jgi:hypothetical protein
MMMAGSQPERGQKQDLFRQTALDALGHGSDQKAIGEDRQMSAMLFTCGNRNNYHHLVSWHVPKNRPRQFAKTHEGMQPFWSLATYFED